VKQLVVEASLLAALGAAAALALAWVGRLLVARALVPSTGFGGVRPTGSVWQGAPVDARTLAVTGAIALGSTLVASLAPALHALRPTLVRRLRGGAREGGTGARHGRLRGALVVAQAALSVLLLVGAGLFVRSLQKARAVRLGVDPPHVLYAWVELRDVPLDSAARAALYERLAERARTLPAVEEVGTALAFHLGRRARDVRLANGDRVELGDHGVRDNVVGGDYFRAVGTRLVRGRAFDRHAVARDAATIVVSERLARAVWPTASPLGRCLVVGPDPTCREVIGVVEDVRAADPRDPLEPSVYRPAAPTEGSGIGAIVVRTRGPARAEAQTLRRALVPLLPSPAYLAVSSLDEDTASALRPWETGATLFGAFGVLGLLVASLGLYGALAHDVAQRRHDYGIRLALGALRGDVLRLVLRRGLGVALGGLTLGLGLALVAGRAVANLLFGVTPHDPLTLLGVVGVLGAVALLASLVPGWRAARVDPNTALRAE
jgi:predicted permease